MRVAAAGLIAILAAFALALHPTARADESNPFPSPSPVETQAPGSGGYAVFGIAALSANGGSIPASIASPSPVPFRATSATGFSLDLVGRLSSSYIATIQYQGTNLHGDDVAVITRFEAGVLYAFRGGRTAAGLSYGSIQRSTTAAASNGIGAGVMLTPDFSRRLSPYGSLFFYPGLSEPANTRGTLSVLRLGVVIAPKSATNLFARLGFIAQNLGATSSSPTSLSGLEFGIGSTF